MKEGLSWSGAVHKLCQSYTGVPVQAPVFKPKSDDVREVEGMASLCGCTPDNFYRQLKTMLEEGTLMVNKGVVEVGMPHWVERFNEVCRDKCLDPDKIGESAVKALERGQL